MIEQGQKDFLNNRKRAYTEPYLHELWEHVESLKGNTMAVPREDSEYSVKAIMSRGIILTGKCDFIQGEVSGCHSNSSKLFLDRVHKNSLIATGYALSEDDLWRQHTWVVVPLSDNADPSKPEDWRTVETTECRVMYFGCILNAEESLSFAMNNA